MATITIEVDDPIYRGLEETARAQNLTPSELVRGLAVAYEQTHRATHPKRHSVADIRPFSVGKVLKPLSSDDDLLEEMLDGRNF